MKSNRFLYKLTQRKDTEMAWYGVGVPAVSPPSSDVCSWSKTERWRNLKSHWNTSSIKFGYRRKGAWLDSEIDCRLRVTFFQPPSRLYSG